MEDIVQTGNTSLTFLSWTSTTGIDSNLSCL